MQNLETARRQPHSVLVVDSDPAVLALISAILRGPGKQPRFRVLRARNAAEAVEILNRSYVPVDLVLSNRPVSEAVSEEGPSIAECVRAIRPRVPVLYMSTVAETETIRIRTAGDGLLHAVTAALTPPAVAQASSAN